MAMNLTQEHAQYAEAKSNWKLVRDIMAGEKRLKRSDLSKVQNLAYIATNYLAGDTHETLLSMYIPMPRPDDTSVQNIFRYVQYVQRAYLFNATRRTEAGMVGMVYQKPSTLVLPTGLEYLQSNADGSECGLEQQSSEVLADTLEVGREGLLVDYPKTDRPTTVAEAENGNIRATIVVYKAESIKDWACKKVGAANVLSMVKLVEYVEARDEHYNSTKKCQYRVLLLNENGQYIQQVHQEDGSYETIQPRDSQNKPFTYIPFFFIGAMNNNPNVDTAPLLDVATVNIHHYRDTADYQESSFMVGQPTPVFSGLTQQWVDANFKDGTVQLGSRAAVPLPAGGSATLLQASTNSMPREGMQDKEQQMVALGARLITNGSGAETAEAAYIKHSGDASILQIVVRNINQAYADALKAVCQFMGIDETKVAFSLNKDFLASRMDAAAAQIQIEAWQKGAISKEVMQQNMLEGGFITKGTDLEKMNEDIDANPVGLGGGFGA